MSENVGSIHYDLDLNTSGFDSAMKGVSNKLKNVGDSMVSVGTKMTLGLTVPIAIGAGIAMKRASDLAETMNKVDVAFGEDAKAVRAWGETTLKTIGLAKGTALDMASLFGDMGTAMGQSTNQAFKMSTSLVQLAGDMASFKNLSIDRVQTALAGVYTGETEALKSLGIVMTQTNLEEFARKEGIKKSMDEMTQAEKVQLRYAYVMSVTKNAQGDFTRTMNGTANQMRYTQERVKELQAEFGEKLLPVMGRLLEVSNKLLDVFEKMTPKQQNVALGAGAMTASIGPLAILIGYLSKAWAVLIPLMANPVFWVVVAIIAVLAGVVYLLYANWQAVVNYYNTSIVPMWLGFVQWMQPVIDVAMQLITVFQTYFVPALQAMWAFMVSQFAPAWRDLKKAFDEMMIAIKPWMPVLDIIAKVLLIAVVAVLAVVAGMIFIVIGAVMAIVVAFTRLVGWIAIVLGWFDRFKSALWTAIMMPLQMAWSYIMGFRTAFESAGGSIVDGLIAGIKGGFNRAYSAVKDGMKNIRNLLPFSPAKEGPFSGKGWTLYSGRSMMQGLADGIKSMSSLPQTAMENALGNASYTLNGSAQASGPVTNSSININGDITLGDQSAVNEFFGRLNRNNELAQKGMAVI